MIENKKENALVSVIIPCYNSGLFIEETIESVLKQTYVNLELIIIDDCSTDDSLDVVEKFLVTDNRIRLVRLPRNSGAAISRNEGIKLSKGRFIAFLDSDDIWKENKLEIQLKFMQENKLEFTCTNYNKIDENGADLHTEINFPSKSNYKDLLKNNCGNSTVVYDTSRIGKIYVPNIRKRNDYLMWLQVIKKVDALYCLERQLSSHRIRTGSISSNKYDLIKYHWRVYRDHENLSYTYSIYLTLYWGLKTFKVLAKKKLEFK